MTIGITLVGAGALGRGLAALLVASGPVTLYSRAPTVAALKQDGHLRVHVPGPAGVLAVSVSEGSMLRVTSDPADIPPDDAVVFVTKGPDLAGVVQDVARSWARGAGWVAGLQNGVQKDTVLSQAFGADAVVGGATVLGARRDSDGNWLVTGLGQSYFGEFGGPVSDRVAAIGRRFRDADLPCETDLDIARLLWSKCANAIGAFGVGALTRLPSPVIMSREVLVSAYLALVRETAAVAEADGSPVGNFSDLPMADYLSTPADEMAATIAGRLRAMGPLPPAYSSMAQDVMAGRPTEVHEVFGDVVARAARHGIPVPRTEFAYRIIAGLQG